MANYYLAPSPFSKEDLFGWVRECVQSGEKYLRDQPAYPYIQEGLALVNGETFRSRVSTLSDARTESVIRNLKELVAAQTNVRIIPAFITEIEEFKPQQEILNKLYVAWQTMTFADRALRKAWQYAAACGTGYLMPRWDKDYWYRGKGDIVLDALGPLDVLPIGLPKSHDLSKAYAVVIRVEMPYHEVVRKWPEFRDRIRPSRDGSRGVPGGIVSNAARFASGVLRKFGPGASQDREPSSWATVDVYYIYVADDTVNNTGQPIRMGDPDTSWEYTVPSVGQEIPVGYSANGNVIYQKATYEDCLLYPNMRLIIATDTCILNPDFTRQVNPYWIGRAPVIQVRADDWPWMFLGMPLTKAGLPLEKANIEMLRGMIDAINARLSPSRVFDRNSMSLALAQTLNPRIPNQVVPMDLTLSGNVMQPLLPAEYYNIPPNIADLIERNEQRISHQMGVADATALARARQLPSGDSLERLLESLGPLIKDQSRNLEASLRDQGEMWKSMVFQFYHAPRIMQVLGPQGEVEEFFQYRPGDLIPEHVPGLPENAPYFERARRHASNFTFSVTPYSLHEMNSLTRKLFHLQLARSGFPLDWWTLAEVFDIKNFGPLPKVEDPVTGEMKEAQTVLERWLAQQEMQMRFAAAAAGAQQPAMVGSLHRRHPGRPPTAQNPPSIEMKSDGRPIVRESKH